MQNIMILYNPKSDSAVFSGGGWLSALPLANLTDPRPYRVARSINTDPANTKFRVALNSLAQFRALVMGPSNVTTAVEYRVRCYNNGAFNIGTADSSPYGYSGLIYDSGWQKPFEGSGGGPLDREWEDPWFWMGVEPFEDEERGIVLIHVLPATIEGMYWTFEIDDYYNPAGYIELSRLFMPDTFQPSINYGYESNGLVFLDNSLTANTLSGSKQKLRRFNPRQIQFGFKYLPETETFSSVYRLMQKAGFDREVFVIMDPDNASDLQRRSMFARIDQMNPIQQAVFAGITAGYQVEEIF